MLARLIEERGVAAIWVAIVLLFLLGSAALAVDASEFWEDARHEQTTADLACLAGVRHLPQDPSAARQSAEDFAKANWPAMQSLFGVTAGNELTLDDGNGSRVIITAPYQTSVKMRIQVTQTPDTSFGRVIGAQQVTVIQDAYCSVFGLKLGSLPFGALPGGFTGGLQNPNPCGQASGNCGAVHIQRIDGTTGREATLVKNIGEGSDRDLQPSWSPSDPRVHCTTSTSVVCHIIETDTGVSGSHLGEGFLDRLDNIASSDCTTPAHGRTIDCDSIQQVFEGSSTIQPLTSRPSDWVDGVHGPWGSVDVSNHYTYNGVLAKCESPRFGSIPIISEDLDYDPATWSGGPFPGWPSGQKDVKIIGTYFVYLEKPNQQNDWHGNGNLKSATSKVIWLGPDSSCAGPNAPVKPWEPGDAKVIRLVES